MDFRRFGTLAAVAALALAVAAPALALDTLTGTYTGKMSCKGYANQAPTKSKQDITIDVIDSKGFVLQVRAGATDVGTAVFAFKIEDAVKTDRGTFAGVDCTLTSISGDGIALRGDAVVKPGNGKATLKGSLTRQDVDGDGLVEHCTFSVKRTSTTAPKFPFCS
jgi:hypothetical protein